MQLNSCLTTLLGRDKRSAPRPGHFTAGKKTFDLIEQDPKENALFGPQGRCGCFRKEIRILSSSRRPAFVHEYLLVSSYTTPSTDDVIINVRNL